MSEREEASEAVVARVMPAPPALVYDEWLDPDALADWMCPRPAYPTAITCDARVGGELRIDIDDQGTRMTVSGRYLELDRPRRLSFTWWCTTWPPHTPSSIVTVTFEPYGDGQTFMTIRHRQLDPSLREQHRLGWVAIVDQLAAVLRRRA
jgi:uncharacterized protein YndB with AHSA1/START domain